MNTKGELYRNAESSLHKRSLGRDLRQNGQLLMMLVPAIAFVLIFCYWPMTGVVLAFERYTQAGGIYASEWVGFANFDFLLLSNKLWSLTRNTFLYNLAFIVFGVILEVGFAILLNELIGKRFKKFAQSAMFLPYFISWVVAATLLYNIFNYEKGFATNLMASLGMERLDLYNTGSAWPLTLILLRAWKQTGYGMVVYLAAITGLDQQMFEAASIDGANVWQKIRHITIPSLVPTIMILVLLSLGNMFRGDIGLFYQPIKNNAMVLEYTDVIDTYVYRSITSSADIGMSAAAGFYQSVLCLVTVCFANFAVKKAQPDYALF